MIIIGEKINGTRKDVANAIKDRNVQVIQNLSLCQEQQGANYLDVNAGTHPSREPEDMVWLVETIQVVSKLPLCLDSTHSETLLKGLQATQQSPMINSVSGEQQRIDQVLPIACDHHASLVLLALDDRGIPQTTRERLSIVTRLVSLAREGGLFEEQLFVDPLVTTMATKGDSGLIALETIKEIRRQFPKVHITCGLSNISFGQPLRSLINQAFAALAMEAGLDSAILDPTDQGLRNIFYSTELVLGRDPDCLRYNQAYRSRLIGLPKAIPEAAATAIQYAFEGLAQTLSLAGIIPEDRPGFSTSDTEQQTGGGPTTSDTEQGRIEELVSALVGMKRDRVIELTEQLLDSQTDPLKILEASKRAMGEVGRLFETEEYFIPELILAGKMLTNIADSVKPHLTKEVATEKKGRVLIGTVAGDIHDIGKDIVVTMLQVNGYEVMDLGVDVPIERFVEAVQSFKPHVVGLSGFLTLVYDVMKNTILAIRNEVPSGMQIMIGGGQIDEHVKSYTGADGYGRDAMDAVRLCREWIGN
jgi:5-methyltetrahydrofolate--homocysteine methyltransferase